MCTVLLVDDDPEVRRSIRSMLERSGYTVRTADGGSSALDALFDNTLVDLVITDYRMPDMDGLVLARRIKERMPDLPVVILTGHADLPSYLHAVGLGVVHYIAKPIGLHVLLRTVRDAVAGKPLAGTPRLIASA